MEDKKKIDVNRCLYICKSIALLSIVTAHTTMCIPNGLPMILKQRFSSIGVIVFIIISGYYYDGKRYGSFGKMLKRKTTTVIIPWIVFGSIAYVWGSIHGLSIPQLHLSELVGYLLGYKTYLYYMTILILCYVVFYKPIKMLLFGGIVLNIISLILTSLGYLDGIVLQLGITHYLNFFNWCGFFALGILFRQKNSIYKVLVWFERKIWTQVTVIIAYVVAVLVVAILVENDAAGYFSKSGFIMELFAVVVVLILSSKNAMNCSLVLKVSQCSFAIYLTHTMILSVLMYVPVLNAQLSVLLPIVTIAVGTITFELLDLFFGKIHLQGLYRTLTGIREIK